MEQSRVHINYSEIGTSEEQEEIISTATTPKRHINKQSWLPVTLPGLKMKIIGTTLVLVTIIAASILYTVPSSESETIKTHLENALESIETSDDAKIQQDMKSLDDVNNDEERLPQLRSYREERRGPLPYVLGQMNIYVRSDDGRFYQRIRIPVARYARRRNPFHGPFLNFMPSTSIFADRSTKQTIIYGERAVYVFPAFINGDDKLFSIAELIASGDVGFDRNGLPLNENTDMARYFKHEPLNGPGIPAINPWSGGFSDGIHRNFGSSRDSEDSDELSNRDEAQEKAQVHFDEGRKGDDDYRIRDSAHKKVKKPYKPKKYEKKTTSSTIPSAESTTRKDTSSTRRTTRSTSTTRSSTTRITTRSTSTTISTTRTTTSTTSTSTSSTSATISSTSTTTTSTSATVSTTTTTTSSTSATVSTASTSTSSTNTTTSSTSTASRTTQPSLPACEGTEPSRTPFTLIPFQNNFTNPSVLAPILKECRSDGHCIFSYDIDIIDTRLAPFDQVIPECASKPRTIFMTYNGQVPGPMFMTPTGHETIVRFNNKMSNFFLENLSPCTGSRRGRPISVHHHGSASAPPYDGWAEDETCFNETKEYVYPNNRPAMDWYHDHALHITADNAYFGLAGLYIVSSKKKHGGCGEPWNLEDIEDKFMIFQDKALDSNCQLFIDYDNVDKENLYGDINLVSGIPFPLIHLEPKWYRFRILNAAVSRPYKMKIKDATFQDVSQKICRVIATDAGFRREPVAFPTDGLLIGVGERYEIVCDFTSLKSQTLYMWNDKDEDFMKDVPYFCYSHLLAKIEVSSTAPTSSPVYDESQPMPEPERPLERVLTSDDIDAAMQMVANEQSHRVMEFERSGGQWVINGETWDTAKIAAEDIGQNTWEVWELKTGGGWFHPVHIHLADFYILHRDRDGGLKEYEKMSPKDIIYLGPSQDIWALIRFGPHKGDYMFHCHNLIHEDDDMMRAFRVINSENGLTASTAEQFIRNGFANIIYSNWKYIDPMLTEVAPKPTSQMPLYDASYLRKILEINIYRIFYPNPEDEAIGGFSNPWKSAWCPV